MPGNLDVVWIHGAPNHCAVTTDPPIQVHRYDEDSLILRQSKCSDPGPPHQRGPSFEAPFLYLLFGRTKALLLDTGATASPVRFPLAETVRGLLQARAAALGAAPLPLLIAHSHSHGDHTAADSQFQGAAGVEIVPPTLEGVKAFFQLPNWPAGVATLDLGGRVLDVLPLPGHEDSHVALYDRQTQLLLTGDSLYPGLLVINDWAAYRHSIARLKSFVDTHPVSFVLGAHIEMTNQPFRWFGLGEFFQPNEHVLQLSSAHLTELANAVATMGTPPQTDRHADFIIFPAGPDLPPLGP